MYLHDMKIPRGTRKRRKIVGRGRGSGHGKTSCRGQKGQMSRSGQWVVGASEGGQSRLVQRLPKVGFRPHRPVLYQVINLDRLNSFKAGTVVTADFLKSEQLISSRRKPFKILGVGEITKSITVQGGAVSKVAKEKIEKAGGKIEESKGQSN